ncbi:hypothetical protein EII25_00975 [Erysipelotrichaceae bacterium OH741_COT-311]|nr:hypothetical protein EII25_00975 [Erysipelotrichaceae bacterium OH741_COT-311]
MVSYLGGDGMKRYQSLMDTLRLPLKILFVAFLFVGIGYLVHNESVNLFYTIKNRNIILLSEILYLVGSFLIINFPFIVLIKIVSRKNNSSINVISGIIGYVVFLIVMMFFSSSDLPPLSFQPILGIQYLSTYSQTYTVRYPVQVGILATLVVGFCTRVSYARSRKRSSYSLMLFIDNDTWAILSNLVYCSIAAFITALFWPSFDKFIQMAVNFVAQDITNPMSLFVYGVADRITSVMGINHLIRDPFWYDSLGGTWLSLAGESFAGDLNVWIAMANQNVVSTGFGRFITPYYILNIFAVPSLLISLYFLYTDKIERRKIRLFLILAMIVSIFTGILLPVEIALLVLSPLLFFLHMLITGSLFAVLQILKVYLGFKYTGDVVTALPGSLPDLLVYLRDPNYARTISLIFMIGIVIFVVYYVLIQVFFKYLAFDLLNTGKTQRIVDGLSQAVGGVDNIKVIHASPLRLTVQVNDITLINFDEILKLGALRVVETRAGFAMVFGASSIMIRRFMIKKIAESKRVDS